MNAFSISTFSTAAAISLAVGSFLQAQSPIAVAAPTASLSLGDRYSEFANNYSDPHAADFNPLGKGNFVASPDMETVVIRSDGSTAAGIPAFGSRRTTDVLVAALDPNDAREVVVRAHVTASGNGIVKVFRQRANGTWGELHSYAVGVGGRTFRWISLSVEDRGDDSDLLHISAIVERGNGDRQIARTTLEVDGGGSYREGNVSFEDTRSDAHRVFESHVDLDGDGHVEHIELVTGHLEQGGFLKITDRARTDYRSANANGQGDTRWVNAFAVGQFDDDAALEVACVETHRVLDSQFTRIRDMGARVVEQDAQGYVESSRKDLGLRTLSAVSAADWREQYRVVGCDFDGAGSQALCVVTDQGLDVVYMPGQNPGGTRPNTEASGVDTSALRALDGLIDAVAVSSSGSRQQSLAVLHERDASLTQIAGVDRVFVEPRYRSNGSWASDWDARVQGTFEIGDFQSQHIAAGDVDGDSMVLRYTGSKDYLLADPLVIGVLAAAPCWSEAQVPSQNRDACSTSMEFSTTRGIALTVSSAYTVSASVGYEVSDLFDAFGAEVKATVTATLERSRTTGSQIRHTTMYVGGSEEDTVVFKGTLYRRYQYEIVGSDDPARIGDLLWIEDPVSTKVFQWPVPSYNRLVDAADRITLNHTVGSPYSYRNPIQKDAALAMHRGFESAVASVPQGTGSITLGLELNDTTSTAESRTIGIGAEFEFKHGNATVGGSFAVDRTTVHEITMDRGTAFSGTVGAIAGNAYFANEYDFGLLVLQPGMRPNGTVRNGQVPYWLITYWVD